MNFNSLCHNTFFFFLFLSFLLYKYFTQKSKTKKKIKNKKKKKIQLSNDVLLKSQNLSRKKMVKQTIAIFIFCILFPNTYPKSSHCLCRVSIAPYQNDLIFFLNRFLSTIIFVLTSSSSELTPNYYLIHSFIKQSIRPFIHSVFFLSITVILFSNPIVL